MASIVKKIIRGHPYYYARVCKRVDGKPKIVSQTYLGRADKILEKLRAKPVPAPPLEAVVREFGASTALLTLARRLQFVEHIDRRVPQHGSGPSVGHYLLAAVLNRCLAPGSKASLARWFDSTALPRLLPLRSRQLTSQRFWDHMHRIPVPAIPTMKRDIVAAMTREFGLDRRQVLFDATNFFTYIDSFNHHSELAQRGHGKEGCKSLRIIGVALLVTTDFRLPLLHRTYPGNRPDAPLFQSLAADLARRCREIAAGAETLTLVFDKGNNSRENLKWVERSPFHFIGSLVPTQHPDLLAVEADQVRSLEADGLPGVRVYRTDYEVFGIERTVLVIWNQALFDAQCRTLLREIAKRRQHLRALQRQLRRWRDGKIRGGRKPGVATTRKKVDTWLRARHMRDLFAVQVREVQGLPKVNYRFQRHAWEKLQSTLLGKTLLFTDQADWSDAELVRGYRAQHQVESAFRQLKDSDCIAIRPQYHWTDQKIAVHVFCCVLALMLCSLLQRELSRHGVKGSIPGLLDALAGIREVDVLYPARQEGGEPELRTTLSQMTEEQRAMYDILGLDRHPLPPLTQTR